MDESPSKVILDDEDYNEVKSLEEGMKNLLEPPGWLPDGWIMEVNRDNDGAIYRYYTCPFSGITFTMKSDVLRYLFSGIDQYSLESKNCDVYDNLTRTHDWLPNGWLVEIRAGGENMDKMYKFYVYEQTGVRLFSKEDVLLYINGMKISRFYTNGQCDASTLENILATLEFNPKGFPEGWVKEVVYRGTNVGGIRKDRHYTDPVRNLVFRTKKQAETYLKTGKVPKLAFVQKTSVHEVYSFEMSAPLHESLRKRLNFRGLDQHGRRSSEHKIHHLKKKYSMKTKVHLAIKQGKKKVIHAKTTLKGKEEMSPNTVKRPRGKPCQ